MIVHLHERGAHGFVQVKIAPFRVLIVAAETLEAEGLPVVADLRDEGLRARRMEIAEHDGMLLHPVRFAYFWRLFDRLCYTADFIRVEAAVPLIFFHGIFHEGQRSLILAFRYVLPDKPELFFGRTSGLLYM